MAVVGFSRAAVAASVLLMASPTYAGPDWIERGDAGSLLETAQPVVGTQGRVRSISGTLGSGAGLFGDPPAPDLEDMYLIRITQPTMFSFVANSPQFNPRLYLFNVTLPGEAFGLLANDDSGMGTSAALAGMATDGTGAMVTLPGVYAIAICGFARTPISSAGSIFNLASPTEISGADGPGGLLHHSGWTGNGEVGSYQIDLTGVDWYDVPTPGAGALSVVSLGLAIRRRRR